MPPTMDKGTTFGGIVFAGTETDFEQIRRLIQSIDLKNYLPGKIIIDKDEDYYSIEFLPYEELYSKLSDLANLTETMVRDFSSELNRFYRAGNAKGRRQWQG